MSIKPVLFRMIEDEIWVIISDVLGYADLLDSLLC